VNHVGLIKRNQWAPSEPFWWFAPHHEGSTKIHVQTLVWLGVN